MQQQIITIAPLPVSEKKTRAAAYVRVSTSKDDQLNSFAAQYIHYKKLLEESISEELVDVYADEGISGTTTKERDAFNKLINRVLKVCEIPQEPRRDHLLREGKPRYSKRGNRVPTHHARIPRTGRIHLDIQERSPR